MGTLEVSAPHAGCHGPSHAPLANGATLPSALVANNVG